MWEICVKYPFLTGVTEVSFYTSQKTTCSWGFIVIWVESAHFSNTSCKRKHLHVFATLNGERFIPFLSKMSVCVPYEVLMLGLEIGFFSAQVTAQSYKTISFPLRFGYITVHKIRTDQENRIQASWLLNFFTVNESSQKMGRTCLNSYWQRTK